MYKSYKQKNIDIISFDIYGRFIDILSMQTYVPFSSQTFTCIENVITYMQIYTTGLARTL